MPQGKLKVKAKVPKSVEAKRKAKKGPAISKRGSAPAAAKKAKKVEAQKLKKIITKSVNAAAEEEIRALAMDGKKSLLSKKGSNTTKAPPKAKKGTYPYDDCLNFLQMKFSARYEIEMLNRQLPENKVTASKPR